MEAIEVKTCDTCTHRGSCDKAELGKPACVSYQVGYKKVVVAKVDVRNFKTPIVEFCDCIKAMAKLGVLGVDKDLDIFNIEVPETFLCNDIIFEIDQENE